jgi:pseudaminic acid biosynthesis-associated methylase
MNTRQMQFWNGRFGSEYTDRNNFSIAELNKLYIDEYGISRTDMNKQFLQEVSADHKILEVGCNVANQLRCLQTMNYEHLYGIELQTYAVEKAKEVTKGINIIEGSAFDIPFKDGYFDMVFTSGVLIHIHPNDIHIALDEIYRASGKYIWGFEYYADNYQEITYRDNNDKMWKTNFAQLYLDRFPTLRLVKEHKYSYVQSGNVDQMFLLQKRG